MKRVKIFVLSLISAVDRRQKIRQQFDDINIEFEFFDGIYGKDLSDEQLFEIYDGIKAKEILGRELTKGEIGATYSHYMMYRKALESGYDYVLILEDDVFFDHRLKSFIDSVKKDESIELNSAIYFIQAHCNKNNLIFNKTGVTLGGKFFNKMFSSEEYFVGAYGYLVNKAAMVKLVNSYLKFYYVCDHWYYVRKESRIKDLYFLQDALISTNDDEIREIDSFIQDDRKAILKSSKLTRYQLIKLNIKKLICKKLSIDRYE